MNPKEYVDIVMMPDEYGRGKDIMMPCGANLLICIDICKVRPCGANHLCARIMRSLLVNYYLFLVPNHYIRGVTLFYAKLATRGNLCLILS